MAAHPARSWSISTCTRCRRYGLTPADVTSAVTAQNITVPSGLAKFGTQQYVVRLNSTPEAIDTLNQVPIKIVNGSPILIRDVAYVRDGGPPQQNIVRQDGMRGVLLTILKNGNASTLSVVNTVKSLLPGIHAAAPKDMKITPLFDQSVFVAGAIDDVIREGAIAAGLTGLMILLFLGSWRSTLIVLISIPLSIMTSIAVLAALGETVNIMTLGGLALAVGILVDDATVAIENTYRLLEEGHEFKQAVVHGAAGIAKPALISTLSICCAFVSVTFLTDAPKFLFTPQALAVVFGMLASYALSRTLVPILFDVLVKNEKHGVDPNPKPPGLFTRIHAGFEHGFTRFHRSYVGLLHRVILHRAVTLSVAGSIMAIAAVLFMFVGTDYFPQIDAGQMTLHVRAPPGTRIEEAEKLFQQVEDTIRQVVPRNQIGTIIDNIGLPASNYNFAFGNGTFVAYNDGQILVTLAPGHASTFAYQKRLRTLLHQRFPESIFYFEAADIITQILDFGVPSQIDVQVSGRHAAKDLQVAQAIAAKLAARARRRRCPSAADHQRARILRPGRPPACRRTRPDRTAGRQRPERLAQRQLPGQPELLVRPADRHPVSGLGANPRVSQRLHDVADQHTAVDIRRRRPGSQRAAVAVQRRHPEARQRADGVDPHQHPADLRRLRRGAGP